MSQPVFVLCAVIQAPDMKIFFPSHLSLPLGHSLAMFPQWRDTPDLAPCGALPPETATSSGFRQTQNLLQGDAPPCH